jgi:trimethylamine--corrinoid protein Co-methyltransferase
VPATLAQQMAEALAGIALVQLIRPGTPVIFGSFLSNTDMQSGSPSFGTPESAVGLLCTGQIARHFGLPWRSGGGLTSSQTADAQGRLRGDDDDAPDLPRRRELGHALGRVAGVGARVVLREVRDRHRDPADAEGGVHAARGGRGEPRVGAHQEVGHGGHFLGAVHTLERFRECFYRPLLSSTENFERWKTLGSAMLRARR